MDGVNDELRRYEAGDEDDTFVRRRGVGEGEDVGQSYVADINLIELAPNPF